MKNFYTAIALIALMTLAAPAFAHDGAMDDAGHHQSMHGQHDKATFEKMHRLHKQLHDAVVADKFDKKAFLSITGQIQQLRGQIERRHAEAFADKLAQMSPEERANMAEKFHEHMMQHHDGHDDSKG